MASPRHEGRPNFDDDHAARLEPLDGLLRAGTGTHPAVEDQIPLFCPELESAVPGDGGIYLQTELAGTFLRQRDRLSRRVEAGDVPSELGEIKCIAPLAHPDVKRSTGRALLYDRNQEAVRRGIETGGRRGEEPGPEVRFEIIAAGFDQRRATLDLPRGQPLLGQLVAVLPQHFVDLASNRSRHCHSPPPEVRVEIELCDLCGCVDPRQPCGCGKNERGEKEDREQGAHGGDTLPPPGVTMFGCASSPPYSPFQSPSSASDS